MRYMNFSFGAVTEFAARPHAAAIGDADKRRSEQTAGFPEMGIGKILRQGERIRAPAKGFGAEGLEGSTAGVGAPGGNVHYVGIRMPLSLRRGRTPRSVGRQVAF